MKILSFILYLTLQALLSLLEISSKEFSFQKKFFTKNANDVSEKTLNEVKSWKEISRENLLNACKVRVINN